MSKIKRLSLILGVLLIAVALIAYRLLYGGSEFLPIQTAGDFSGQIELGGVQNVEGQGTGPELRSVEFFIDQESGMYFSKPGWALIDKSKAYKISSPYGELYFLGREYEPEKFEGSLENSSGKDLAAWTMNLVSDNNNLQSIQEVQLLNVMLNLSSELQDVESKIMAQTSIILQQKSEVERLSEYLTEGKELKTNADKKYQQKKSELESLQGVKAAKLKEAEGLKEKFDISQRLFGIGKLVFLSRNSLDLEKRWFNSMYSSTAVDNDADFDTLVARAERILTLKNEISFELNNYE